MECVGELMGNSLIEDSKVYCYHWGGSYRAGNYGMCGRAYG